MSVRRRFFFSIVCCWGCSFGGGRAGEGQRMGAEDPLFALAERRGFVEKMHVHIRWRQWLAQRLLKNEVEQKVVNASLTTDELEAFYRKHRYRFDRAERRASVHLLAKVPADSKPEVDAQARVWVEGAIEHVKRAPDPVAALHAYPQKIPAHMLTLSIQTQEVPALSRDTHAEPAYIEALFAQRAEGLIPYPVKTGYGWHAIVLKSVEPAVHVGKEEALRILKPELLVQKRKTLADALLEKVRRRHKVHFADTRIDLNQLESR